MEKSKELNAQAERAQRQLAAMRKFCGACVDRQTIGCPKNTVTPTATCRRCNEHLATIK